MLKIEQLDKTIINIYTPNKRSSKYIKQQLIKQKGKIDRSTKIAGDSNMPFSRMDKLTKEDEETENLNKKISQLDLRDTQNNPSNNSRILFSSGHSFQVHMRHSPGQITFQGTK